MYIGTKNHIGNTHNFIFWDIGIWDLRVIVVCVIGEIWSLLFSCGDVLNLGMVAIYHHNPTQINPPPGSNYIPPYLIGGTLRCH